MAAGWERTDLPAAAREPRQPHARHVEQPHLPVVVWEGDYLLADAHVDPVEETRRWVTDEVAQASEFADHQAVGGHATHISRQTAANSRCYPHTETEPRACSARWLQHSATGGAFSVKAHRPGLILYLCFSTQRLLNVHEDQ